MLQSISWSEFLITVGLGLIAFYTISCVLLYTEEIKSGFQNGLKRVPDAGGADSEGVPSNGHKLVGTPRSERSDMRDGMKGMTTEELQFAPLAEAGEEIESASHTDSLLVGSVADLGEEVKTLCTKLATTDRKVAIIEFKSLLNKYSKLGPSSYRSTINLLISDTVKDHADYRFGLKEIDAWWDQTK